MSNASGLLFSVGKSTVSITWITPLLYRMSVFTTFAPLIMTLLPIVDIFSDSPLTVLAEISFTTLLAFASPATTW